MATSVAPIEVFLGVMPPQDRENATGSGIRSSGNSFGSPLYCDTRASGLWKDPAPRVLDRFARPTPACASADRIAVRDDRIGPIP